MVHSFGVNCGFDQLEELLRSMTKAFIVKAFIRIKLGVYKSSSNLRWEADITIGAAPLSS